MTRYGGMDCDIQCGKCVINVRYGERLGPNKLIIGAVSLEEKSSHIFQFIRGLLKFIPYRLHCFFKIYINGMLCEIEETDSDFRTREVLDSNITKLSDFGNWLQISYNENLGFWQNANKRGFEF